MAPRHWFSPVTPPVQVATVLLSVRRSEPAARVSSRRTVLPQMNATCWLSAVQDSASVSTSP